MIVITNTKFIILNPSLYKTLQFVAVGIIDNKRIISYCPNHGKYVVYYNKESNKLEYNTPLRNLVRGMLYGTSGSRCLLIRVSATSLRGAQGRYITIRKR